MTEVIAGGGGIAALLAAVGWFLRKQSKQNADALDHVVAAVRELRKQNGHATEQIKVPEELTARMDVFDLRLNEFKEYIDRKTRAIGQERRRLQKLYPEVDDEDEPIEEPTAEQIQAVENAERGTPESEPAEAGGQLTLSQIRDLGRRMNS